MDPAWNILSSISISIAADAHSSFPIIHKVDNIDTYTLQEHQTVLTNATISRNSDIGNALWSMRNLVFQASERNEEMCD